MACHSGGSSLSFTINDSGERRQFDSGMVRDTADGKVNFLSVRFGPMLRRWAEHLTKGRTKYPDTAPGTPNWTLAAGVAEYLRAKESAARHFEAWLLGERDEDHASGVFFNVNLAEYILERDPSLDPSMGAVAPQTELEKFLTELRNQQQPVEMKRCSIEAPHARHTFTPMLGPAYYCPGVSSAGASHS